MKTTGIMLQNLIVPCQCHCRYCLLSWDGKTIGCDYKRSEDYAKAFHDWLINEHPEINFNFCIGYSMDHPQLMQVIDFANSIGSVSGRFLQMDGLQFRNSEEIQKLMNDLVNHGVRSVNFTFYGNEQYHDRFAGRKGDYRYLLSLLNAAKKSELSVSAGIAISSENYKQIAQLVNDLDNEGITDIRLFIPHEEGRGVSLADSRLSLEEFNELDNGIKKLLNRNTFRTEAEWMNAIDILPETQRSLLISLTPDNIDKFENMGFEEVIKYVESLDDQYYHMVPGFEELLKLYGAPLGQKLYSKRDIYQHYQKKYLKDNNIDIYDVTDERYCGSRRHN